MQNPRSVVMRPSANGLTIARDNFATFAAENMRRKEQRIGFL
jgi:hypothetical protein